MKKGKLIGKIFGMALVFAMIGSIVGGLPVLVREAEASLGTIYVPDNYTTIQAAVDAASPGDTIIVRDGTYTENVDVNKDHLTVKSENGADSTIVQAANSNDHVFEVMADYINIQGFTVQGATGNDKAGIYLDNVNQCGISDDTILNNEHGICLINSSYNTIVDNTVDSCVKSGIILDYSPTPGPYLPAVGHNVDKGDDRPDQANLWEDESLAYDDNTDTFAKSKVSHNTWTAWLELLPPTEKSLGIRFWIDPGSQRSFFRVEILYSDYESWDCLKDWNFPYSPAPKGEWVVIDFPEKLVERVRVKFHSAGYSGFYPVYLSEFQFKPALDVSSSNNEIVRNTVSNNGAGIRLYRSSDNRIYLNNFTNNTDNGYSSDSSNLCNSPEQITYSYHGNAYTNYLGNYWSDYGVYSPAVGHNDPGDQWEDETLAYDENRDTFARVYLGGGMGSSPLELLAPSGKPTEGIRFWGSGGPLCVDIYYDGYWHCLQDWPWGISSAPANEWVELTYPSKIVEMARIIFHGRVLNGWSYLNEFQFKTVLDKSVLDVDGDGIGDTSYSIDSDNDNYPLMEPFENYEIAAGPWSFAIITDLHIGRGFDDYGTPGHDDELTEGQNYCLTYRLADVVSWINSNHEEENIKFLVILGDISDTAEKSEFLKAKEILDELGIPYIPLIGNHDTFSYTGNNEPVNIEDSYFEEVFWDSSINENVGRVERLFGDSWQRQEEMGGFEGSPFLQNYNFSFGGVNFLCLDYARRDDNNIASIAEPFLETKEWLQNHLLGEYSEQSVIVFSHYPYCTIGGVWPWEEQYFVNTVRQSGCNVLSFGGHIHDLWNVNGVFYATDGLYQIPVIVTKGMMEQDPDFLRIVQVNNGENIDYDNIVTPTTLSTENIPSLPNLLRSWISALLQSPGELRVYDSQRRVVGIVNGQVKAEIPYSHCQDNTITILLATESYFYEMVGTEEGGYGLELNFVYEGEATDFIATDIPTTTGAVHQYTIDWDALSRGEEGVTVYVDSDGDGITDYTLTADSELTGDEFISQLLGCFIATAAYGTPMAEEIQTLREFRDEYLLTSPVGQSLVNLYYRVSPPMAEFITEHPSLKPIVRAGLVPAMAMSTVVVNTTPAEKMAMIGLLVLVSVGVTVWVIRRRGGGPEYT